MYADFTRFYKEHKPLIVWFKSVNWYSNSCTMADQSTSSRLYIFIVLRKSWCWGKCETVLVL